jgi:hypothetical protein
MSFEKYAKSQTQPEAKPEEKKPQAQTLEEEISTHNKKRAQEKNEAEHKQPVAGKGETLAEILADNEKSSLFSQWMEEMVEANTEDHELFGRLVSKELKPDDFEKLDELRAEFIERMNDAARVEKTITPELVTELATDSQELQRLINMVGTEKAVKAFKSQIKTIAVTDFETFEDLQQSVDALQSYESGELGILKARVEKLCKEEGISAEEYWLILSVKDEKKREKAFIDMARKSWGTGFMSELKRIGDWVLNDDNARNKIKRLTSKEEVDEIAAQLEEHKKKLVGALVGSVEKNESLRNAFTRQIVGSGESEPSKIAGMKEAEKEAETISTEQKKVFDSEIGKVQQAWTTYKKQEPNWDKLTEDERDLLRESFMKMNDPFKKAKERIEKTKKQPKKGGFWVNIFQTFFGLWNIDKSVLK